MASASTRYRIGFDIGGTFTDFVLLDESDQTLRLHKCLTTPADPSVGALQGMRDLLDAAGLELSAVGHVVHGTTLATNAIIERKGARLGFLTTRGFRDILEMGTEQRYDIHDLFLTYPEPLASRRHRREIAERIDRDGSVIAALDLAQVRAEVQGLVDDGVEAIAVCFIHAYANPAHERAVRDLIRAEFPALSVSISSDVHAQIKEYERSSTTAANAYVQPLMSEYVRKLSDALREQGFRGRFHLIQSSGGLTAPETAAELPIRFLESGPAGGAQATGLIGRAIGHPDVLSFDMGGTTAKAALIQDGEPDIAPMLEAGRVHRFKKGSGIPVFAPVIDMIEIGAGGGSIARVDDLGLLKVGPDSAGADPGPACYGAGGTEPTVTDANLLLGYLDPGYFLGGRMTLDVAAAARVHIVEKGRDPRRYAMVAMGGAGPLHAARVARQLGMREVIVPPASGAASALGFLGAPVSYEIARSFPVRIADPDYAAIEAMLAELEAEGRARLAEAGAASGVTVQRKADMRLRGQMHELSVTMPSEPLSPANLPAMVAAFTEEYQRRYTHLYDGAEIEVLNWRVVCAGPVPTLSTRLAGGATAADALKGYRKAWVPERGAVADVPVYDRYSLPQGQTIEGPAIVEEREATTIVPDACSVSVDEQFNLRLSLSALKAQQVLVGADTALDEAVARIEGDPVGLEIMWSRLINVAEECWHTVIRTAFSLIIGEAQDFACEILDAEGKQIVHSPRAMPVFNLTLPVAVNAMIEKFPPATLEPGDVLVTNDPWLCAGHLFDIAVAVPVFRDDRVVAFVGVVGHVSDIGGTKDSLNAREIYDEGFQIPPMKLFRAGKPNEDLLELLRENVRRPDQVLGDLHALVASGMTGAERIGEFMEEYGMHDLKALAAVVQRRAENAMRAAIRAVPDGIYEHRVEGDGIEHAMSYPIQVSIQGDQVEVRFDGAPAQMDRGGSNCTLTYTKAHATYPLKCIFSPEVPGNAGCYRPMTVDAPTGSILNCDRPLSVNMRTRTGWYVAPNVFGALADAAPERVQAFTGLPSSALFYGVGPEGIVFSDHLFQGGGQGASSHGDGKSALLYPTSAANTSVELFETRVPALVLEKALMADSGGPGRKRGGLGQTISTRKLQDDGRACQVGMYPNGVLTRVQGLFGGKAGAPSAGLVGRFGEAPRDIGVGALSKLTGVDQYAELRISGGSGFGDPLTRGYDEVQADLDEGYVTPEGARRDYGCVVGAGGRIDRQASDRLRKGETRETEPAE